MLVFPFLAAFLSLLSSGADDRDALLSAERRMAAARAVQDSIVQIEYALCYDKGEEPRGAGWQKRCPSCGQFHASSIGADLIKLEHPLEQGGYLVSPTQVLVKDMSLHPRFIKSIHVRSGDDRVEARVTGYALSQNARLLQLDKPLPSAKPLTFQPSAGGPYFVVTHDRSNGAWTTHVASMPSNFSTTLDGAAFVNLESPGLITTSEGVPVAVWMSEELPPDDSWKSSYETWSWLDAAGLEKKLSELEARAAAGLLRVTLAFRSPRKSHDNYDQYSDWDSDGDENSQERNVIGVVYSDRELLVLSNLAPKVTARLERIVVYPSGGAAPMSAKFAGSLDAYGAFVAQLEKPLPGEAVRFCDKDVRRFRNDLLLGADVTMKGDNRSAYFSHQRIPGFSTKWKGRVYPEGVDSEERIFLFNHEYELVALHLARRKKVSEEESQWGGDDSKDLTPAPYVSEVLAAIATAVDPGNVPLSEEEENRLAWLGVELQPLNRELARVNNVADLTRDGELGAIVSYVYPDSPAAARGIAVGSILLRLHMDGQPKPIDVMLDSYSDGIFGEGFPWDDLADLPAEYFDQLPTPWPSAENNFTRMLTDAGFGKAFEAEFVHEGKASRVPFEVVQSPPHYGSAPQFKSEEVGLTVRDLTYEARRYFQKAPGEAGVIVSKVEPGGKAAVAKLLPYEIVTHVNSEPVTDVKAFEAAISGKKELRLSINRMHKGRIVTIKLSGKQKSRNLSAGRASEANNPDTIDSDQEE